MRLKQLVEAYGYQVQVLGYIGASIILGASLSSPTRCLSKAGPPQTLVNNTNDIRQGRQYRISPWDLSNL